MFCKSLEELNNQLAKVRSGRKVVFTNGCFDILHIGHVRYLQEARQQGDLLVVAVNTDASVRGLKGPERPIQNEEDRAEILASLDSVDFTVLFGNETPIDEIKSIKPEVLVKGGDWPIEKIVGSDFVLANGGEVKYLQFVDGRSSTNLIEKIKKL